MLSNLQFWFVSSGLGAIILFHLTNAAPSSSDQSSFLTDQERGTASALGPSTHLQLVDGNADIPYIDENGDTSEQEEEECASAKSEPPALELPKGGIHPDLVEEEEEEEEEEDPDLEEEEEEAWITTVKEKVKLFEDIALQERVAARAMARRSQKTSNAKEEEAVREVTVNERIAAIEEMEQQAQLDARTAAYSCPKTYKAGVDFQEQQEQEDAFREIRVNDIIAAIEEKELEARLIAQTAARRSWELLQSEDGVTKVNERIAAIEERASQMSLDAPSATNSTPEIQNTEQEGVTKVNERIVAIEERASQMSLDAPSATNNTPEIQNTDDNQQETASVSELQKVFGGASNYRLL